MHNKFNVYNVLSMHDEELKMFFAENYVPKVCYITDSGHGWNTGGKRSKDGTLRENQYNSIVEGKIGLICQMLREKGLNIQHYQLATEHQDISLALRVKREHEIFHEHKDTHLVLGHSIHADASDSPSANGTTTFYLKGSNSSYFADIMQDSMIEVTKLKNRGARDYARFYMLRKTMSPFILTEAAFMTNPREKELLKSDNFRNLNAIASVDAVLETALLHHKKFISWA